MTSVLTGLVAGAVAGAAGVTALNALAYGDMVVRGRGASHTPELSVEKLAGSVHVRVPGTEETRAHRTEGLGALLGMATGAGVGALAGAARAAGVRLPLPVGAAVTTLMALSAANGPMTVLGVTDPRTWSKSDWVSDVVPHAGYGAVTSFALRLMLP